MMTLGYPRSARVIAFCVLIHSAPTLWAQAVRPTDADAQLAPQLEEIRVSASRLSPDADSTALFTRDIEDAWLPAAALTPDLLRASPGVFLQQTTPGQAIPIVRGLKGSQVLHLVDGFRVNNAFYRSSPNQYLALIPRGAIARVELARGAVGTLYGSDAMGGLVHLRGAQARFNQPLALGVDMTWSSAQNGYAGTLRTALGSDQHTIHAGLSWDDMGNRRVADGVSIPYSGYESQSAWLHSQHQVLGGLWQLQWQSARQPSTPRVDELNPGFGQDRPASSEFFFEPNARHFTQLSGHYRVSHPLVDELHLQLGWQRIQDHRRSRDVDSPARTLERNQSDLIALSMTATRYLPHGHRLRYGADITDDTVGSERVRVNLADDSRREVAARFPDQSTMASYAAFADYHHLLPGGSQIELGLRHSRFIVDIAQTEFGGEAGRITPTDTSARLGLRVPLSKHVSAYSNLSQGFRAPNIFDLGSLGARPGNRFNIANTDLAPERITSLDLGVVVDMDRSRVDAAIFAADYRDQITSVLTGDQTPSGRLITQSANLGEVLLYGLEVTAHVDAQHWRFDGGLNWTWGEVRAEGPAAEPKPADRIPPLNGFARLRARAGEWDVTLRTEFAYRQDRLNPRDRRDPRINPHGTPGWVVVGIDLHRSVAKTWQLGLSFDNLGDQAYREHGSGIDGAGRSMRVSLSRPLTAL